MPFFSIGEKIFMEIAGIVCEYNPFHLGHQRQLRLCREVLGEDTSIVCVMSGNYVQRGMPAMWDKFARAEAALVCGADVVLELPVTAVLRSAEGFADAGVDILSRFGCTHLCFGAECGNADMLMRIARQLDTDEARRKLREGLDRGLSYAAARQLAARDETGLLEKPNNILGLEYCRAILRQKSDMIPLAVLRNGNYHAQDADICEPSATAVRSLLPDGPWQNSLPTASAHVLSKATRYDFVWGERAVLARLRSLTDEEWEKTAHGSEGLWRKAMKACRECSDFEHIVEAVKSKRYPRTRIQRLLLCAYLGITDEMLHAPLPYVRVLSVGEQGKALLRRAKIASGRKLEIGSFVMDADEHTAYLGETEISLTTREKQRFIVYNIPIQGDSIMRKLFLICLQNVNFKKSRYLFSCSEILIGI